MSGGSYNYVYSTIESFADDLHDYTPNRKLFKELLYRIADAAHDIEWVDSSDYGRGKENAAIEKCFVNDIIYTSALSELKDLHNHLDLVIKAIDVKK